MTPLQRKRFLLSLHQLDQRLASESKSKRRSYDEGRQPQRLTATAGTFSGECEAKRNAEHVSFASQSSSGVVVEKTAAAIDSEQETICIEMGDTSLLGKESFHDALVEDSCTGKTALREQENLEHEDMNIEAPEKRYENSRGAVPFKVPKIATMQQQHSREATMKGQQNEHMKERSHHQPKSRSILDKQVSSAAASILIGDAERRVHWTQELKLHMKDSSRLHEDSINWQINTDAEEWICPNGLSCTAEKKQFAEVKEGLQTIKDLKTDLGKVNELPKFHDVFITSRSHVPKEVHASKNDSLNRGEVGGLVEERKEGFEGYQDEITRMKSCAGIAFQDQGDKGSGFVSDVTSAEKERPFVNEFCTGERNINNPQESLVISNSEKSELNFRVEDRATQNFKRLSETGRRGKHLIKDPSTSNLKQMLASKDNHLQFAPTATASQDTDSSSPLIFDQAWNFWDAPKVSATMYSESNPPAEYLSNGFPDSCMETSERHTKACARTCEESGQKLHVWEDYHDEDCNDLENLLNLCAELNLNGSYSVLTGMSETQKKDSETNICEAVQDYHFSDDVCVRHEGPRSIFYSKVAKVQEGNDRHANAVDFWVKKLAATQAEPFRVAALLIAKASMQNSEKGVAAESSLTFPKIVEDWLTLQHLSET